jgi:hypothetical protein
MFVKDDELIGENLSAMSKNQGSKENANNDGPTLSEQTNHLTSEFNDRDLKASSELQGKEISDNGKSKKSGEKNHLKK